MFSLWKVSLKTTESETNHRLAASAVWTRFNPVMLAIQKAIHEDNLIGEIRCMYSDLAMDAYKKRPNTNRLFAAELGGGSLLDLGPYPLVWVSSQSILRPLWRKVG